MPISSLPSDYGIGSFGKNAFEFVDFLCNASQTYWQILPLGQTSYGDSPYQSTSIFAGNPYFVDLELLKEEGLLTESELLEAKHDTKRVDYEWLFNNRYKTLRKAFNRFKEDEDYQLFIKENDWVYAYALFMALKVKNEYCCWNSWNSEEKDFHNVFNKMDKYPDIKYWIFIQYEFFKQWKCLKKYANDKGILIIGDMPIYCAYDSVEVWQQKEDFLLDENYNPTVVAGCPPDAFSDEGQLWGNPIYNYPKMKEDNFIWWVERIEFNLNIYDILRVDHFRGFESYYVIPYGDINAINGHWEKGYGYDIFDCVKKQLPNAPIIAEDLGLITKEVVDLIEHCGFPRMKVLQFAFDELNNEYLPRMYPNDNCIVYTGTHDSDCTYSWIKQCSKQRKYFFNKEVIRKKGDNRVVSLIKMALNSIANYAIIPLQDYMGLSNEEARMNMPSTSIGNWQWRVSKEQLNKSLCSKIRKITIECQRGRTN